MKKEEVISLIEKQSKIYLTALYNHEKYEFWACEVFVFDAIREYWEHTFPVSFSIKKYADVILDNEDWLLVKNLFIDFEKDIIDPSVENEIYYLFRLFQHKTEIF